MAEFGADPGMLGLWIGAMVFAGILGGLLAGLLGVGGGIVIVPVLYHVLAGFGVDETLRMKVAVATSLATIIATSAVSVRSHHRRGAIDFALLKTWGIPIFIGVVIGSLIGGSVDGRVLTLVFAVVALFVAANMLLRKEGAKISDGFPNRIVAAISGLFVGVISAMMGIGGGTLSVPILSAFGFDIRRAVGTAAAIGFIIAIPGTIGYVLTGLGVPGRPPFSLGYLNLAAAAALVPLTMATAPLGAKLAHTMPRRALQLCFAVFLGLTSLRMFMDLL